MAILLRFLAILLLGSALVSPAALARETVWDSPIAVAELPPEARQTLALIKRGGPFPYAKDGSVFGNFERRLPIKSRGYYREYTVKTPGARNRGARRIVVGGDPDRRAEYYYTEDHYKTFRPIKE